MSFEDTSHAKTAVAISRWADKFTTRLELELTNAWPDLADRLEEAVASLSKYELALGPGEEFQIRRFLEEKPPEGGTPTEMLHPCGTDFDTEESS
jgi:hypothetical protein